jgi:dienelactone hydrolase
VVKGGVAVHPSSLVKEEAAKINKPVLFLCAEKDDLFPPDLRKHFEQTLAPTNLGTFIDYPGTVHGFAIRPDDSEHAQTMKDKAVQDAIQFFKKTFKIFFCISFNITFFSLISQRLFFLFLSDCM